MEMSAGEWFGALGQVLLVIAISFAALCAITSFVRFQLMTEKALEAEELGGEEEKGFRLLVMNQIATARKARKPISVVLLRVPVGATPAETIEKHLSASLRKSDKVVRIDAARLGINLQCGSEKAHLVARRIMALESTRQLHGHAEWHFGVAGYPEHGHKTSEIFSRAAAMLEEAEKSRALIAGMAEAEAVADAPETKEALDSVTGLIRDQDMISIMRRFVGVERRNERPASMIYFQIDGGDRMAGKPGYDAVLKELSVFFTRLSREGDVIARHGSSGFVIGMTAWPNEAVTVAQRISFAVRKHVFKNTLAPKVTLSAGVAGHPDIQGTAVQYFLAAEAALERARQSGRNQIIVYDSSMRGQLHTRNETAEDRL